MLATSCREQPEEISFRQPANLVFIRGTQGIATPIKKLTKSPYTHVAGFVMPDQLIESQGFRKTGYQSAETYEGVSDVYTCDILSPEQRLDIVHYVTKEIGTPYDYLLIGLIGVRLLFKSESLKYTNQKRQICTTLWVDAYRSVGVDLCPGNLHPTPGDLAQSPLLRQVATW